jgi:hypothetical protein
MKKILLVCFKGSTPKYSVDYSKSMSFPNRYDGIQEMIYRQRFQEQSFESEVRHWIKKQGVSERHFHLLKQIYSSRKL